MSGNKITKSIPIHATKSVTDGDPEPSGHTTIDDLAFLESIPNDARLLIQTRNRTFYTTKGDLITSIRLNNTSWDDFRFPASGINPPGLGSDPDRETSTGLLLFDSASTEIIAGVAQLPHAWKETSDISPHVHWQKTSSAAGDVLWQFDYEVVNNGAVAAMDYGTQLQTTELVAGTPDNDTANEVLISEFDHIDMPGMNISCLVFWKLSRIGVMCSTLTGPTPG